MRYATIATGIAQNRQDFSAFTSLSGHFHGLVQPTEAERTLNGFRLKTAHRLDWQAQYEKAIKAFTRHGYIILVDDKQSVDLDASIELRSGTEVTFFKLVPLVGG